MDESEKQILNKIITTLRISSENRNDGHAHYLHQLFQKTRFYELMKSRNYDQKLLQMCQKLKSKACPKETYLFRYGDIGDAFYMILKGQVVVNSPRDQNKCKVINKCM